MAEKRSSFKELRFSIFSPTSALGIGVEIVFAGLALFGHPGVVR
jgi:hypothetical protein